MNVSLNVDWLSFAQHLNHCSFVSHHLFWVFVALPASLLYTKEALQWNTAGSLVACAQKLWIHLWLNAHRIHGIDISVYNSSLPFIIHSFPKSHEVGGRNFVEYTYIDVIKPPAISVKPSSWQELKNCKFMRKITNQ